MNAKIVLKLFVLMGLAALPSACNRYDPYNPDTANLVGVWAIDNGVYRRAEEVPIEKRLTVYATHMEYCPGNGTYGIQGQWRNGGFWCQTRDGSGEFEAVKVVSPEEVELHVAVFGASAGNELLTLYKEKGSDAETQELQRALAIQYPPPLSHPPPSGVIHGGMTEYQLRMLPWKADKILGAEVESKYNDATIYTYYNDNPSLPELKVTVKDHKVIAVSGGNG